MKGVEMGLGVRCTNATALRASPVGGGGMSITWSTNLPATKPMQLLKKGPLEELLSSENRNNIRGKASRGLVDESLLINFDGMA